ncbi:DNA internalization-related competence protein ComEC/Rec2 [Azovibrio restrictus]|uniref:DNA internalization-related competence protein ComEC/Rec2 n=1 Tax=Azovibrio restrictus TaxID=146938 RepID=UPI0026F259AC|nr:DNA internalization-related competence protein ComEC/Rec2 [Azovibrio restrictus]
MGRATSSFLLGGVLGILVLQQQAGLPSAGWRWCVAGIVLHFCLLALGRRNFPVGSLLLGTLLAGSCAGFGWAAWRAELRLADALEPAWEGQDLRLTGQVASLPVVFERGQRFEFRVEAVETAGVRLPERLWLSVYHRGEPEEGGPGAASFRAGERWRLTVRLKRPHGSANPGGFDYEAWLLERNLRATGHVRASPPPERLDAFVAWPPMNGVHRLRQQLRETFARELGEAPHGGILVALAIGDQRSIPTEQWTVFNRTGTTHLMSISGLHVTLVASLAGWLVLRLWRRFPTLCLRWPAPRAAILAAWLTAVCYALLAGFGIPAQRTCLMLTVVALAMLAGRDVGVGRILLLALTGVLIADPWAVLAPGFWLSFAAVAALLWVSLQLLPAGHSGGGWRTWLREFGRTQWAATLATLPILLWVFQQFPLVSPLANLLAIPLVSFLVTPLVLLAAVLAGWPGLPLLALAHGLLTGLMAALEWLSTLPLWQPARADFWAVLLAMPAVFLLLLPRGVPGRGVAWGLLLPLLFWPRPLPEPGSLRVTVLDVGQGQAVLLETAGHRLLYDAGPAYGSDDAGRRVVLPYLQHRGIERLDLLVVSHRDNDHAGGLDSLRQGIPVDRLVSSIPGLAGAEPCARGQDWEWDGVRFAFLHPQAGRSLSGGNEDSCVLRVASPSGRLLLSGDIGVREEALLVAEQGAELSAEVLLLPHHGSTTSSSLPFVAAVGPQLALVSAGYRNRFRHPRPEVLERYEGLGARVWRTDRDGALILDFAGGRVNLQSWRQAGQRYWWGR